MRQPSPNTALWRIAFGAVLIDFCRRSRSAVALALLSCLLTCFVTAGPSENKNEPGQNHESFIAYGEKIFRDSVAQRTKELGPEHEETIRSRSRLANLLWAQERNAESEKEYRELLAIQERLKRSETPLTLEIRVGLAGALDAQAKHADAEKEYRIALAGRERIYGPDDSLVIQVCRELALCLEKQNKLQDALSLIRRVEISCLKDLGAERTSEITKERKRIEGKLRSP